MAITRKDIEKHEARINQVKDYIERQRDFEKRLNEYGEELKKYGKELINLEASLDERSFDAKSMVERVFNNVEKSMQKTGRGR